MIYPMCLVTIDQCENAIQSLKKRCLDHGKYIPMIVYNDDANGKEQHKKKKTKNNSA